MNLATYNIRGRSSFGVAVGDGIVDLVTKTQIAPGGSPYDPRYFVVRIGLGDGTFFPAQTYAGGPAGVAVADVNGDGRADILAANDLTNDVMVYLGTRRPECK